MKKYFSLFLCAAMLISCFSFQTSNDNALARVSKINGHAVFYHNEPVSNYEVAFTFKNSIRNFDCNTVESNMDAAVKNANMEAGEQMKLYDALIIGSSDRDIAVTFTDKTKDNSIARVKREGGVLLFLGCEPLSGYNIVKKIDVSGEAWKMVSGQCPTWESKIEKILKKVDRKKNACDAIILGDTKWDFLIKFK